MIPKQYLRWAQKATGVAVAVSYVLAVYSVMTMQIIPLKYLLVAVPVISLPVGWLVYIHLKKYLSFRIAIGMIIFSLALTVVNLYVFSASSATTNFLRTLQAGDESFETYSIIAKKDRHIDLAARQTYAAGLIKSDNNTDAVVAELHKQTTAQPHDYDELMSLTVALDSSTADIGVVKSSYVDLLQDGHTAFYQSIEVLATFTVKAEKSTTTGAVDISKPFVVYISGIDTYGSIASVSRSDVNMLLVINPKTHKILLVNTPRDYYVQLHGTTGVRDKLTHAGIYGIDSSIGTLEDLYATDIGYYLRVNFSSLVSIVDVVGGINVYSDHAFKSYREGYNTLNGQQALEFSRERYSFAEGDRTRGKNQQRVIEAIISKMNDPKSLVHYRAILGSLQGALQTNMPTEALSILINNQLDTLSKWQVESISVDGTGKTAPTYSMGDIPLYVMEPDIASLASARQKIQQYLTAR
jgi:LCP family protein required for cell wall assembly